LIAALLLAARRQGVWRRAGWGIALAVFAVSAQHLSHHEGRDYAWWIELSGHHASLPLAVAILYQDYRFALADIFLKRALVLILLVALAFGLYQSVAAPLLATPGEIKPFAVGVLLALWVATAIVYPMLRRAVNWVVDALLLRRADYDAVRAEAAARIETLESSEEILNEVCSLLARALTARDVRWVVASDAERTAEVKSTTGSLRHRASLRSKEAVTVAVLTTELPRYNLLVGELAGGRRLLSDDLAMLESVAVAAARRIDAVRVIHERCVRDLHEQEMHKLATEAELRALRAQINPHFLFNALTTLGYLIQTAPDRAGETLMRLTTLLRAVLRHSDGEFTTLGDEIELIEAYLEIERARFEDRLRVTIDVPPSLRGIRIPALLVQPLVENAIKHGISPSRAGGDVAIEAGMLNGSLRISVRDTGLGASQRQLDHGRKRGVGLANVEQRIRRHYGDGAIFDIHSAPGVGTTVDLALPVHKIHAGQANAAVLKANR
jgi:two-component system LytT family sensor kinase